MTALFTSQISKKSDSVIDDYFDEKNIGELISIAVGILKNRAEPHDAVFNTYLKAKIYEDKIRNVQNWVRHTLKTTCIDLIKDGKRFVLDDNIQNTSDLEYGLFSSEDESFENEYIISRIEHVISQNEKDVFHLSLLGYEPKEIAEILNRSEQSVYTARTRSRRKIKTILKNENSTKQNKP
jgi:RNA polymerase sigma factor (sigma-70 family)